MVRGRIARTGERIEVKIGLHLAPRDDRHVWTVELAREKAKVRPSASWRSLGTTPTRKNKQRHLHAVA